MEISDRNRYSARMANSKATQHKTSKLPLMLSLLVVSGLVVSYFLFPAYQVSLDQAFTVLTSEDPDLIREWVSQFRAWGPVVIVVMMVLQMFLLFIPNILLIFIAILCYGPLWGGALAWLGIVLASTVGYFIGKRLGPVTVQKLISENTQRKLKGFIRAYGMKAIVVLRLSSFSNDGLSLVAGLLNMQYRRFIVATILGITPLITILALFGKNARIEKGLLWVGVALVLGLFLYIFLDRRSTKGK